MASSVSRSLVGRLIFSGRRAASLGAPSVLRRTFTRGPAPRSAQALDRATAPPGRSSGFLGFSRYFSSLPGMLRGVFSSDPCQKTESNLCNGSLLTNNEEFGGSLLTNNEFFGDYVKMSGNKLHKLFYVHIPTDAVEGLKVIEKLPNLIDEINKELYTSLDTAVESAKCTFEALDEYPSIRMVIECDMQNIDDNSKRNLDHRIQILAAKLLLKNGFRLGKRPDNICDTSKGERALPGRSDPPETSGPAIQ